MAFPYTERYSGGFINDDDTRPVDDTYLNAVEAALIALMNDTPAAGELPVWDNASSSFKAKKLTNAEVDAAAAIAKSKLDFGSGLVNGDIAAAAGIVYSKLNLAASIVNGDIAGAAAIGIAKLASYPTDATKFLRGDASWTVPVLSYSVNQLSGDVTMTNANQYYTGPELTLAAGTWFLGGVVSVVGGANNANFTAKLWDASTVTSSVGSQVGGTGNRAISMTVLGVVVPSGSTAYKISVASDGAGGTIKKAAASNGAGDNASTLVAIRIA